MAANRSISTQWALRYALATFVVVASVLYFHWAETRIRIERDAQLLLRLQANELVGQLQRNPDDPAALEHYLDEHEAIGYRMLRLGFRVIDPDGNVVLERGSFERQTIPMPPVFPDIPGHAAVFEQQAELEYPFYTMTVRAEDGGWVQAAVYTEVFARSARELAHVLGMSIPLVLVVTTAVGLALGRASLRPVARLITTAEALSATRRTSHVPVRGTGDELDRLAGAFNAMMDRLHAGVERMQRFSAEVAHELRTPVSLMRVRIEAALDAPREAEADRALLEQTLGDVDRLSGTIRAMLQLAHSEAGLDESRVVDVPLHEILSGIVDFFEPVAEESRIDLSLAAAEEATIAGDPTWLHQLFANLADNAIKFSPEGRAVSVTLGVDGEEAVAVVEDNGPGIPAHECERIFETFHRLDAQAPGSGLGLPLAREIARAHGGDIELESEVGKGSRFVVRLPLSPSSPAASPRSDAD